ncbi:MAG: RDD family protein, partial [Bacteroidetes bacterium]|nr:RDD family protein [Bacteroidota bacterium]
MTDEYPGILKRVKAYVADWVVILLLMIIAYLIFSQFKNVADSVRIIVFLFIFLIYDPLFTSLFGGTIGHLLNGIRVKRAVDEERNIIFPLALIRFIFKTLLGWLSMIT